MPKCDFNKVALQLYWNCTLAWVFSCKFSAYFQNTFSTQHPWMAASANIQSQVPLYFWRSKRILKRCKISKYHVKDCNFHLTRSWRRPISYRNQSIDLQSKSMDWFLHDNGLRHERVNWYDYHLFNLSWYGLKFSVLWIF